MNISDEVLFLEEAFDVLNKSMPNVPLPALTLRICSFC